MAKGICAVLGASMSEIKGILKGGELIKKLFFK
jgi:hypothetical protein